MLHLRLLIGLCVLTAVTIAAVASIFHTPDPCSRLEEAHDGDLALEELDALQSCDVGRLVAIARLTLAHNADWSLQILEKAAARGSGPAAFMIGEMYDPKYWDAGRSPFANPEPDHAARWYRRALSLGDDRGQARLAALEQSEVTK